MSGISPDAIQPDKLQTVSKASEATHLACVQ